MNLRFTIETKLIDDKGKISISDKLDEFYGNKADDWIQRKINRLEEYAKWIQEDINKNVEQGIGLNNQPVAPLKPSTIKRKGSSRIFVDKGRLLKGTMIRKIDDKYYQIYDSSGEGYYVQTGKNKGNTARVYFGASEEKKKMILDDIAKTQ